MTRARAACIVFDCSNEHVLLMHRYREEQQYYVVPGGGIEPNETAQEACLRELTEETSLTATDIHLALADDGPDGARTEYFVIDDPRGRPRLDGPEAMRNSQANRYELRWIAIDDIETIPLRPAMAAIAIAIAYAERQ